MYSTVYIISVYLNGNYSIFSVKNVIYLNNVLIGFGRQNIGIKGLTS